jgi:hypothetical protein
MGSDKTQLIGPFVYLSRKDISSFQFKSDILIEFPFCELEGPPLDFLLFFLKNKVHKKVLFYTFQRRLFEQDAWKPCRELREKNY